MALISALGFPEKVEGYAYRAVALAEAVLPYGIDLGEVVDKSIVSEDRAVLIGGVHIEDKNAAPAEAAGYAAKSRFYLADAAEVVESVERANGSVRRKFRGRKPAYIPDGKFKAPFRTL